MIITISAPFTAVKHVLLSQVKKKLENVNGKPEYIHIYRIQTNFNILCNLHMIWNSHKSVSSFYEENNFEPC